MQTALVVLVFAQLGLLQPSPHAGAHVSEAGGSECALIDDALDGDASRSMLAFGRKPAGSDAFAIRTSRPGDRQEQITAQDRWLAVDKVQHFAMAYGTAMFGYSVLRGAGAPHDDAQTAALAGSLAAGVGKELYDRARGGPFSLKDLTWDALGTLAAWGLLSLNR